MNKIFPERLHTARKNKEFTQQKLADLVGLSHSAVVTYENGKRTPSIDALTKFALALDVCCSWLLGDVGDNPQSVIELLNIRIDQHKESMKLMKDLLDTKDSLIKILQTENQDIETQLTTLVGMKKIFDEKARQSSKNGSCASGG